jgi:hypothetical protein
LGGNYAGLARIGAAAIHFQLVKNALLWLQGHF